MPTTTEPAPKKKRNAAAGAGPRASSSTASAKPTINVVDYKAQTTKATIMGQRKEKKKLSWKVLSPFILIQ